MKLKHKACRNCLCKDCVFNRPEKCPDGCAHCATPERQPTLTCDDKTK